MVLLKPFILFQPDRLQLSGLELRDGQISPRLRCQEDGGVHEFQEGLFAKGMRNDLGPPALFEKEPLQKVCGPDVFRWVTGNA